MLEDSVQPKGTTRYTHSCLLDSLVPRIRTVLLERSFNYLKGHVTTTVSTGSMFDKQLMKDFIF